MKLSITLLFVLGLSSVGAINYCVEILGEETYFTINREAKKGVICQDINVSFHNYYSSSKLSHNLYYQCTGEDLAEYEPETIEFLPPWANYG